MTHEMQKHTTTAVIVLLAINVLLLIYVGFFKHDAVRLETMKVGGKENMNLVQQLYNSDMFKTQQTQAIQQALSSINTPTATAPTATAPTATQPTTTQPATK